MGSFVEVRNARSFTVVGVGGPICRLVRCVATCSCIAELSASSPSPAALCIICETHAVGSKDVLVTKDCSMLKGCVVMGVETWSSRCQSCLAYHVVATTSVMQDGNEHRRVSQPRNPASNARTLIVTMPLVQILQQLPCQAPYGTKCIPAPFNTA